MSEVPHISASALSLWKKCQMAGAFRYIYGLKIPPPYVMMQGKAFDKAESHNFEQKVKSQEDEKLSVVEDVLHETFQEENRVREAIIFNEGIEPVQDEEKDANEAESKALDCLRVFHGEHTRGILPTSVQRQFEVPILGLDKPYSLTGIIDAETKKIVDFEAGKVEEGRSIVDLKLLGKSMSEGDANLSEQLTAYDAAVLAETGHHADQVALLATIKTKTPKVQFLPSTRTDDDTNRFLKGLGAVVKQVELIKDGKMNPMPAAPGAWWCSKKFCGYWEFCPVRPNL